MGFFDFLVRVIEKVDRAAEAALEFTRKLAEEARQKIRDATEDAERVAEGVASRVKATADGIQQDLEKLKPNFDDKLKQIMDEVTEVASAAAAEGVDITEAVDSAVEIALKKVEEALKAAVDTINRFLYEAQEKLFGFLEGILPDWLHWTLKPVRAAVDIALKGLNAFADKLKEGISLILGKIKVAVQAFVRKVGEVLGPVWKFFKALWKLLFGAEPEHCQMVAEWFEERMERTENKFLYSHPAEPAAALIRKNTYFELLPQEEDSWKTVALDFLNSRGSVPAWSAHRERMMPLLISAKPKPGNVIQLTWDEPFTDALGGRQRVQISILYFRWKTDEFRKVSAGFLGIIAMISAIGPQDGRCTQPPPVQEKRDRPLQIDSATRKRMYDEIAPYLRLRPMEAYEPPTNLNPHEKGQSRQLRTRGDDGVWRDAR